MGRRPAMLNGLSRFSSAQSAYFDLSAEPELNDTLAPDPQLQLASVPHHHPDSSTAATAPPSSVSAGLAASSRHQPRRRLLAGRKGVVIRALLACLLLLAGALAGGAVTKARLQRQFQKRTTESAAAATAAAAGSTVGFSPSSSQEIFNRIVEIEQPTAAELLASDQIGRRLRALVADKADNDVRLVESERESIVGLGRNVSVTAAAPESAGISVRVAFVNFGSVRDFSDLLTVSGLPDCSGLALLARAGRDGGDVARRAKLCCAVGLVFLGDGGEAAAAAAAEVLPAAAVEQTSQVRALFLELSGTARNSSATPAGCPQSWRCLTGEFLGPSDELGPRLQISQPNRLERRRIVDQFLVLLGRQYPHRYVMLGGPPSSAGILRSIGRALTLNSSAARGSPPRLGRSIVLAFWGDRPAGGGASGISEFRGIRTSAYVATDLATAAASLKSSTSWRLRLKASPLLNSVFYSAAKLVVNATLSASAGRPADAAEWPAVESKVTTDGQAPLLPFPSGIGSQAEFAFHFGIPTAEPELVADPDGPIKGSSSVALVSVARIAVDALLRLSESPLLPYDCESLARTAVACHNSATVRLRQAGVATEQLRNAVQTFVEALRVFSARIATGQDSWLDNAESELNEQLALLSRSFQDNGCNLLMGGGDGSGPTMSSRCFPRLSRALDERRRFETEAAAIELVSAFRQAASMLDGGFGGRTSD